MRERPLLLVTGGSRGIGAAICLAAAREGYDVAVNYRSDEAAAQAIVAEARRAGARAEAFQADLASEADIVRLFAEIDQKLGRLTHFVNNAGITGHASRLDATTPAIIRACIDVNVTGAILAAREAINRISRRQGGKGGAIVNISSAAATLGSPDTYVWYAASKGAIDSLTIGLAQELAGDGIRVNGLQPGIIDTEIHEKSTHDAGRVERALPSIPLKRIGVAEEIAASVLFLLSDASSYTTGAILRVAGGR